MTGKSSTNPPPHTHRDVWMSHSEYKQIRAEQAGGEQPDAVCGINMLHPSLVNTQTA